LVTFERVKERAVEAGIDAAVRVKYGAPLVVLRRVNPVAPVWAERLAAVVERPVGAVQEPEAVVQYWRPIDPIL